MLSGMGYRPRPVVESTLISFNTKEPATYKSLVDDLDAFLKRTTSTSRLYIIIRLPDDYLLYFCASIYLPALSSSSFLTPFSHVRSACCVVPILFLLITQFYYTMLPLRSRRQLEIFTMLSIYVYILFVLINL